MHNGHLTLESGKMSKSLGNAVRIRDILDEVPVEALRMLYVESHYRSPLPYSTGRLISAMASLDRIYQAKEALMAMAARPVGESPDALVSAYGEPAADLLAACTGFRDRFGAAMDEDFNSAKALGELYTLVRAANRFASKKKALRRGSALAQPALEAFALVGRVLGVAGMDPESWYAEVRHKRLSALGKSEAELDARVEVRNAARAAKDWATADAVRDELATLGVVIMDGASGTTWRMRIAEPEA